MEKFINANDFKRIGEEIKQVAGHFDVLSENIQWQNNLKPYETAMLSDVKKDFMLKEFNGNVDELNRISKLSLGYSELADYYEHNSERDRMLQSSGSIVESKYDCNLTLAEAVPQYLGCSYEEAVSAYSIMNEANKKYDYYVASIRNNYKGSLGAVVGKSDEEYKSAYPEKDSSFNPEAVANFKDSLNKFKPSAEAMSKLQGFADYANNVSNDGPKL